MAGGWARVSGGRSMTSAVAISAEAEQHLVRVGSKLACKKKAVNSELACVCEQVTRGGYHRMWPSRRRIMLISDQASNCMQVRSSMQFCEALSCYLSAWLAVTHAVSGPFFTWHLLPVPGEEYCALFATRQSMLLPLRGLHRSVTTRSYWTPQVKGQLSPSIWA